jgi:hypothetical protein
MIETAARIYVTVSVAICTFGLLASLAAVVANLRKGAPGL